MSKNKISFNQFLEIEKSLEIKYGIIQSVESIPKSTKLRKLTVDFGEQDIRTVVTNMVSTQLDMKQHNPEALNIGSFFVTNLEPVKMMGVESHAMILPGTLNGETFWIGYVDAGTTLI